MASVKQRVRRALRKRRLTAPLGLAAAALTIASVTGAAAQTATPTTASTPKNNGPVTIDAKLFAKITPPDPAGSNGPITILEGPAFGPDGELYMVHPTAAPGAPKVIALNTQTRQSRTIYTDATSRFSSLQFSPLDGKLYLTDSNGSIDRMNPDGTGITTVFSGAIDGQRIRPDDLTFDEKGAMFITDYSGTPWAPTGRVIRLDPDGTHPSVLMKGLAGANGISFDPAYSGLWVSELTAGREDYLRLSSDHTTVTMANVAMSGSEGVGGYDSNAVDVSGNVYQCVINDARVDVWKADGTQLASIVVPQTLSKPETLTTNLVIKPGTRDGYIAVGGEDGGYVYSFTALGLGDAQSNGGGA